MRLSLFLVCLLANLTSFTYAEDLQNIPESHRLMLEKQPYQVLGVGAACVDLLIPVDEAFLQAHVPGEKGGSDLIDLDTLNTILATSQVSPHMATGGSCANTIKSLAKLGEKCAFLGHRGDDYMGDFFAKHLEQLGVAGFYTLATQATARVLCLITPDGQRTMRFFAGSSREMAGRYLHADYFKNAKLVHLESYAFRNENLIQKVMRLAKESDVKISIDLASFEIVRQYKETILDLLNDYVDVVFANEDEVFELTGLSPEEGCFKLQEMVPVAVVLRGKKGCLVGSNGQLIASPAYPAQVVDTTAAGDLFASGFLYGYLKGKPLAECARLGNRLGSAIVEVTGSELPEAKWDEILKEL
jgi:sugar/nucleoside kinase (ribokinase family)